MKDNYETLYQMRFKKSESEDKTGDTQGTQGTERQTEQMDIQQEEIQ